MPQRVHQLLTDRVTVLVNEPIHMVGHVGGKVFDDERSGLDLGQGEVGLLLQTRRRRQLLQPRRVRATTNLEVVTGK